ncbi:MAG: CAP domain-containing protein, partial [Persicimonas sp.]
CYSPFTEYKMLTRRIFKNCLVALMCLTFVAAGCGDDNDGNNGGGGELSDAGNNSAQDGSSNNNTPDEDGGSDEDADGGSEEDVDPNYDPCNDPDDPDAYCPCDDGMSYCDGECVDVNGSSEDHCGACGATCLSFTGTCQEGTCVCDDPDRTWCDGYCVVLEEDEVNCGECGNECGGDDVCFDSSCMSLGERIAAEINQVRSTEAMCAGDTMDPSSPLRFDPLLTAPAQEHAEDMAANDGEAQGDLNDRISQSEYEGQIILPLLHPRAQPSELIDAIFEDYCSEALDPDADAIGVGVAGEVGERSWVVLIATDA